MDDPSPETRADKIERITEDEYCTDPAQDAAELLADIRHFCDRRGLAYHELDRRAHGYYLAEVLRVPV